MSLPVPPITVKPVHTYPFFCLRTKGSLWKFSKGREKKEKEIRVGFREQNHGEE